MGIIEIHAETIMPITTDTTILKLKKSFMFCFAKKHMLIKEIMQKNIFVCIGNLSHKKDMIGEKVTIEKLAPKIIGKRVLMLAFASLKKFPTEYKISSKTLRFIAVVPPLTPGMRAPIPIA